MPFASSSSSTPGFVRRTAESDEESETSSSDEENGFGFEEEPPVEEVDAAEEAALRKRKRPPPITISLKKVCKVCKESGHEAGFRGATYIDCPKKPCFLCKMPGHTTMFCPHRVAMEHGVIPAPEKNTKTSLDYIFKRQINDKIPKIKPEFVIPDQVDCGLIRFHSRRITCLEFHPTRNNILLSGDKGPATWRMLYGMDVNIERSVLFVADNFGYLYSVDMRSNKHTGEPILIHKKGSKVVGLHCNPVQPDLLLSCGNDHFARIWDARRLNIDSSLASLAHGRVVNSAYFSPLSGNKILTTSQDNRIRVWDSIFGNLESPSREIVHSHDFNRHLTPFRAEWDPKDPSESLAVIGRYISENYDGVALHPIDFIDTSTGKLVAEVMDTDVTTITPVNKLHPHEYILASGSSRTILIWKIKPEKWKTKKEPERKQFIFNNTEKKRHGKVDSDSDGDSDLDPKGRRSKTKKCQSKCTKSGMKKS